MIHHERLKSRRRLLLRVQCDFLLKLRFGMADSTGSLQYASHSWIPGRMSLDCISQCPIDSLIGILSSVAASRVDSAGSPLSRPSILLRHASLWACCRPWQVLRCRHPGQPSLRPHCSKSALRRYVLTTLFSISTSPGRRGTISGPLHSVLDVECVVAAIWRQREGSYSEYSVRVPSLRLWILLMLAVRVLIALPCSVTTTASDDESSIPTNTPGWNRGSHFPRLADLAGMYRIFSPNSRIGVLSLRPWSFHHCRRRICSSDVQRIPVASTISLRRAGLWLPCGVPAQPSVPWPDRQRAPPHVR